LLNLRQQNYKKESVVDKKETSTERLLHKIEGHVEDWRESTRVREEEVQAYRGKLWAEVAEQERLLVRAVSDEEASERSLEEVCKERQVAFVVHSEEDGKALEKLTDERARLATVIPGSGCVQRGAGIKGSWLVFEQGR
jgi:hypothetical protein